MNSVLSQSDRFNPVFLKEIRQTLHGWAVPLVLGLELLVLLAWLMGKLLWPVDLNQLLSADQEWSNHKPAFLLAVAWRLMLPLVVASYAAWVILMTQIRRFTAERDAAQADLVFLTTLTPARFLWGQWLAGMSLALLPISLALPFWLVVLWELPTSIDGVVVAGVVLSALGGMLGVVMVGVARGAGGSSLWRQIASIGCWFFGMLMLPWLMMGWFYWLVAQRESETSVAFFLRSLAWMGGLGWLGLVAVGVFAWALLVVSSVPNTRRAERVRGWLKWALAAGLLAPAGAAIWFAVKDLDFLWLTALPTLLVLWKAGTWKIQRLGHPTRDGLVVTLFWLVRRGLAACRRTAVAHEDASGNVWLKLRFFDQWPLFADANPVLIKELRQAIRNLLLPAIIVMAGLSGFLGLIKEHRTDALFYRQLYFPMVLNWLLVGWAMGIVLMQADQCRKEAAGEENELLFTTPLSPRGLVNGKWALMAGSVLLISLGMLPQLLMPGLLAHNWRGLPDAALILVLIMLLASRLALLLALLPLPKMLFQGLGGLLLLGMFLLSTVAFMSSLDSASWLGLLLTSALLAASLHAMAVALAGWPRQAWRWVAATVISLLVLFLAHLPLMIRDYPLRVKVGVVATVAIGELVAWMAWRHFVDRQMKAAGPPIAPGYFQNPRKIPAAAKGNP
jgi:hypothetical protein